MENVNLWLPIIGATSFGAVIGWMVNHVLQRAERVDIKWLASLIGVIGGGAVTAIFEKRGVFFGAYCVGLAIAFFGRAFLLSSSKVFNPKLINAEIRRQNKNAEIQEQNKKE